MRRLIVLLLAGLLLVSPTRAAFEQDMPVIGKVIVMTQDEAKAVADEMQASETRAMDMQEQIITLRALLTEARSLKCS